MIRSESNSWNNFKKSKKQEQASARERGRRRPSPKKVPEPVHLRAQVISIAGSGKRVFEKDEYSLNELIKCDRIVVHSSKSSKLRQLTKTVRLLLRRSMARVEVVKGGTSKTFRGTFKATLKVTDL